MTKMVAVNPDGSRFFVNLNADANVSITIAEAYTLVASLRQTAEQMRDMLDDAPVTTLPTATIEAFEDGIAKTWERVTSIELGIARAKDEQVRTAFPSVRWVPEGSLPTLAQMAKDAVR